MLTPVLAMHLPSGLATSWLFSKYPQQHRHPPKCVQKGVIDTQLIAHDREVYDIAWGGTGVFASVSADGSVRVFDLRYASQAMLLRDRSYV